MGGEAHKSGAQDNSKKLERGGVQYAMILGAGAQRLDVSKPRALRWAAKNGHAAVVELLCAISQEEERRCAESCEEAGRGRGRV